MSKKNLINVHVPVENCSKFSGNCKIEPNKTYNLIISYPLEKEYIFKYKSETSDLTTLIQFIGQCYEKIFKNRDEYGAFGYIDDLILNEIFINGKTFTITIGVKDIL